MNTVQKLLANIAKYKQALAAFSRGSTSAYIKLEQRFADIREGIKEIWDNHLAELLTAASNEVNTSDFEKKLRDKELEILAIEFKILKAMKVSSSDVRFFFNHTIRNKKTKPEKGIFQRDSIIQKFEQMHDKAKNAIVAARDLPRTKKAAKKKMTKKFVFATLFGVGALAGNSLAPPTFAFSYGVAGSAFLKAGEEFFGDN